MTSEYELPPLPESCSDDVARKFSTWQLEAYAREAVRMNARESRATTHAEVCWSWGPAHYDCAVGQVERLRAEVAAWRKLSNRMEAVLDQLQTENERLREDAARYRWLRDPCSGAERVIFYCRGDYGRGLMSSSMLDAAIDAAMQRTSGGDHD